MNLIINKAKIKLSNTEVFWNQEYIHKALVFMEKRPNEIKAITLFKETFGRQSKCRVLGSGNRRFYIWTFQPEEQPETILYALIHNEKGILFEYPYRSRQDKMLELVDEIYKQILKKYEGEF